MIKIKTSQAEIYLVHEYFLIQPLRAASSGQSRSGIQLHAAECKKTLAKSQFTR